MVDAVETKAKMPARNKGIVKLAVEMPGETPQLLGFDQKVALTDFIAAVCEKWNLSDATQFALQYADGQQCYITENSRMELKDGDVLRLTSSPAKAAQELFDKLQSLNHDEKKLALQKLSKLAADVTFAAAFIRKKGVDLLIQMVEGASEMGEALAFTMTAFLELMDHGMVSWDTLTPKFIKRVASQVNKMSNQDATILQKALSILESIVSNSADFYQNVANEITFTNLTPHLKYDVEVQQSVLALMNTLCIKAPPSRAQKINEMLSSKETRTAILDKIIRRNISAGTVHQLAIFQRLTFNLLEERMNTKMDPNDQSHRDQILELRKIAFDMNDQPPRSDSKQRPSSVHAQDWKKLGFTNTANPALDFTETPPGMLALDNMHYFAKNHSESYTRVVLENSSRADEHECPFVKTSIELTKLLCKILKIGEPTFETGQTYYPMFFTCDNAFEEFYCICITLLNKTWREMRATNADFDKVIGVVTEQIERVMSGKPSSMEQFRNKVTQLSYSELQRKRQEERSSQEELEKQPRPIKELRDQIAPEIQDLIRQQRLGCLVEGAQFSNKLNRPGRLKDKYWCCRLSPNHKVIHYGEITEKTENAKVPPVEELPNKLLVSDIKTLVTGKECPHMKEITSSKSKGSNLLQLAFSVLYDPDEALNFIAPDDTTFNLWTDGINALLSKPMTSEQTKSDMEMLLSMEMKLRLLDTENIPIPENPPPIPPEPSDYNFYYGWGS